MSPPPMMLYDRGMQTPSPLLFPLIFAVLAGCGSPSPEVPPTAEAPVESSTERGVILSARPLGSAAGPQARLVSQVVGAAQGAGVAPAPGAVEIIIRLERGGRDMALIQPAQSWLQPGQRVRVTPGAQPSVARDTSGA